MQLIIASGNRHKVAEIREMVQTACPDVDVLGVRELGVPPPIEETAEDFVGNAVLKAHGTAAWLETRDVPGDALVIADDSGICVDAFDGAPGVRSARFDGLGADDEANNRRLVKELRDRGIDRSSAHYACVIAVVRVDDEPVDGEQALLVFEGRWDVEVRTEQRGTGGFGYDPHAWIDGGERTVAELSREDKAKVSHRGRALSEFLDWVRAHAD